MPGDTHNRPGFISCDWEPPAAGGQTGTIAFTATAAQGGTAALNASFLPTNNEVPLELTTAELNVGPPPTTSITTTTTTTTTTTNTTAGETTTTTGDTTTSAPGTTSSAPTTSSGTGGVSGSLPPTGSSTGNAAAAGALALALGVTLLGVARLRRRNPT